MPGASFFGSRGHWRFVASVLVGGLSGCTLFGCAREFSDESHRELAAGQTRIPLPRQALLERQRDPGCTSETSGLALRELQPRKSSHAPTRLANHSNMSIARSDVPAAPIVSTPDNTLAQVDATLAQRIKLEYERDCFRRAEARVRQRLLQLQVAVGATVKAVRRSEQQAGP